MKNKMHLKIEYNANTKRLIRLKASLPVNQDLLIASVIIVIASPKEMKPFKAACV